MSTLLYRGHTYDQYKEFAKKPAIKLTYRRQVYQTRQAEAQRERVELKYRGVAYIH
ncbi:hypothetical protein SynBIOSU31_03425 [Synechococcus sp. BIOS-U3-1]|uniref:DUF4278 domain-containing protein n=1 Tax=Synechococcus sp. BIOS-U3-1 TaxID=1400865 RepID=UPI0016443A27|nr:DUF4278 domain-containing protein [Synechococcus sp. BIOS-U3-1]QNI60262.1 hypothetical protein SynBIOSU31_03425 [Synechococcus sp. BIOS-U3-1]|tara:strand:+ start:197 stop:364 length:168 start_codon:yes stop_codon:yes gene_type:complete